VSAAPQKDTSTAGARQLAGEHEQNDPVTDDGVPDTQQCAPAGGEHMLVFAPSVKTAPVLQPQRYCRPTSD